MSARCDRRSPAALERRRLRRIERQRLKRAERRTAEGRRSFIRELAAQALSIQASNPHVYMLIDEALENVPRPYGESRLYLPALGPAKDLAMAALRASVNEPNRLLVRAEACAKLRDNWTP